MFNFEIRKITKQGRSLPMEWMKDNGIDLNSVKIEMDINKNLRIAIFVSFVHHSHHIFCGFYINVLYPPIIIWYLYKKYLLFMYF